MAPQIKDAALSLLNDNFSVIPCRPDKRPTVPTWKPFQERPMTPEEVEKYFVNGASLALVCGKISGNLEDLDFDNPALFAPFMEMLTEVDPGLAEKLVRRKTPNGYSIIYRCKNSVEGNHSLATAKIKVHGPGEYPCDWRPGKKYQAKQIGDKWYITPTAIETRGEGGYFLTTPSPGYAVIKNSLLAVPILTPEEVQLLHTVAKCFNEVTEPTKQPKEKFVDAQGTRPGDDFNRQADFRQLLENNGWQSTNRTGPGGEHWTRPGKSSGTSATLKEGCLYIFSSNAGLPLGPHDAFSVYAHCNHNGDFTAAAKELSRKGYGKKDFAVFAAEQMGTSEKKTELSKPIPLPYGLPQVEPFDYRLLPAKLAPWVQDICERVQCPPDYVGVTVMTALGSIIGRKIGIRPQAQTDWTVTPNQWSLLIGRPGVLKSPAMEAALAPAKALGAKAQEIYQTEIQKFAQQQVVGKLKAEAGEKAARAKLKENPQADVSSLLETGQEEAPVLKRYIANDTSAASLGELHRQNHNGLLVHRDELVSLLKQLERDDNSEARGFYLTGWNGDSSYTFDRITRGMNLHIPAVCLSLLGSTQPGRISHFIKAAVNGGTGDDGLLQRFGLTVWPDTDGKWQDVDRWPDNAAKKEAFRLFDYLDNLSPANIEAAQDSGYDGLPEGIPYLRFDGDGLALFREWRSALEARLRSGDLHPALESHLAKYRKLVPGLALIIHVSNGSSVPVKRDAVLQALAWSDYLESHAKRLYASLTVPEVTAAEMIISKIRTRALTSPFVSWQVWRPGWSGLSDRELVAEALQLLVDFRWLHINRKDTGGRPSGEYEVNPEVMK